MRKLHLKTGIWEYSMGKSFVVIKEPNKNKRYNIPLNIILGKTWDYIERAMYKGYGDWGIKPHHVRYYIENNLEKDK
jgi:hypothetical protein